MKECGSCGHNCGSCGGCAGCLVLTREEMDMLAVFAQIPFLPVARKADDMTPVYLETQDFDASAVLACLEKKALIDIDYHMPLSGFDYSAYSSYPLHGSMALTQRGHAVVEMLDIQGAGEEI